jgi:hypothetical protein
MASARKPPAGGQQALRERQKLRADLKAQDIVWIGIAATETNLQRLGAYLMFCDHPVAVEKMDDKPLPWEDPNDPRFQKPPELEIDYTVVRHSIAKHLVEYVKRFGEERARAVLTSFGASRLSSIPEAQLIPLHDALERALETKREDESGD